MRKALASESCELDIHIQNNVKFPKAEHRIITPLCQFWHGKHCWSEASQDAIYQAVVLSKISCGCIIGSLLGYP